MKSKWDFKRKLISNGQIRYKARLLAKGFSQLPGIDFVETFSPIVRTSSIILLIAIAAQTDLTIHHFDIATAFLYGELEEQIFMEQPECFEQGSNKFCLLKRAKTGSQSLEY